MNKYFISSYIIISHMVTDMVHVTNAIKQEVCFQLAYLPIFLPWIIFKAKIKVVLISTEHLGNDNR